MARHFLFSLNTANRYQVEFLLRKRGRQETMTNAKYIISRQQVHLVGFVDRRRFSIGAGTTLLNIEVTRSARTPVAT